MLGAEYSDQATNHGPNPSEDVTWRPKKSRQPAQKPTRSSWRCSGIAREELACTSARVGVRFRGLQCHANSMPTMHAWAIDSNRPSTQIRDWILLRNCEKEICCDKAIFNRFQRGIVVVQEIATFRYFDRWNLGPALAWLEFCERPKAEASERRRVHDYRVQYYR